MSLLTQTEVFTVIIAVIAGLLTYIWSDRVIAFFHSKSLGQREYILNRLDQMFIKTNSKQVTRTMLLLSFGLGGLFFILFWPRVGFGTVIGGIVMAAGWTAPKLIVDMLFQKRVSKFVDQMVDGMTIMANGINSGLSVQQSMDRVVTNMQNPISQEFGLVLANIRIGQSLEQALNTLGNRIPAPEVQMFVTSVNILNETGKGLAPTFQTIMETIRERQKVEKKIEALTAQAKTQGLIVSLTPFIICGVLFTIDPAFVKPLFTSTLGIIFVLVALALVGIGGTIIRKVAKIDV